MLNLDYPGFQPGSRVRYPDIVTSIPNSLSLDFLMPPNLTLKIRHNNSEFGVTEPIILICGGKPGNHSRYSFILGLSMEMMSQNEYLTWHQIT